MNKMSGKINNGNAILKMDDRIGITDCLDFLVFRDIVESGLTQYGISPNEITMEFFHPENYVYDADMLEFRVPINQWSILTTIPDKAYTTKKELHTFVKLLFNKMIVRNCNR